MASFQTPGPLCQSRRATIVADGTLGRTASPTPGPVGCSDAFAPAWAAFERADGAGPSEDPAARRSA